MRAEAAKDKSKKHDFEAGIGNIQHGMSLGADNQKEVAITAQQQCQLQQQSKDSKILRINQSSVKSIPWRFTKIMQSL